MCKRLNETLGAYQARDPAARSKLEIFLLYPGVHAIIYHRLAHFLYRHKWNFLARFVSQWSRFWTGIEIHPGAKIGRRFVIDHGAGIVIGETTEIGDDVLIYQGATLGGTGKDRGKRHPTIGNNVMIGSGARVLGPFRVGDNSRIASGAVVLQEVPPDSTAVGVPAKLVRVAGVKVNFAAEVDQIHVLDPIQTELKQLCERVVELERKLAGTSDPLPKQLPCGWSSQIGKTNGAEAENGAKTAFDQTQEETK
ncbi:MAG: serine O-acetyltransferase EpsC [Oscillospiraceae bacterium]|jgi:serine O-acetyltransferase